MPFKEINAQEIGWKMLITTSLLRKQKCVYPLLRVLSALSLSQKAKKLRVPLEIKRAKCLHFITSARPTQEAEDPKLLSQTLRCGL